jgi:uncharacterized protein (DUF2249 family)
MNTESRTGPDKVVDVREIPCATKHPLLVETFINLPAGEHFILLNGHEPLRLRDQFSAQWPGTFAWEKLPAAPGEFRIKITKHRPLGPSAVPIATKCRED